MKKITSVLAVFLILLLSACKSTEPSDNRSDLTNTSAYTSSPEELFTAETTSAKISAVEDQPENTSSSAVQTDTKPSEAIPSPEGFPAPYPGGAVEDSGLLSEFKEKINAAETANSIFLGANTLIPTNGNAADGYLTISPQYASDTEELIERMYEGFKYSFWEDKYGEEIENMLPGIIRESENGLQLIASPNEETPTMIDVSSAVISELNETTAKVVALGTDDNGYIWRTYDMLNGVRGWVVRMYEDETVTGEIAVFSRLLIDKRLTLDKIFGNAEPVYDENGDWNPVLVTIENDIYGHGFYNGLEIEPFMTIEEMRRFIRDTFTSEIAESYISLYVNRSYVEKDGHLYLINGAVLPQMGEFSLEEYENRSISSFDATSAVSWSDGENSYTVPITIKYEDGVWKLDTRLPMKADRIIGK